MFPSVATCVCGLYRDRLVAWRTPCYVRPLPLCYSDYTTAYTVTTIGATGRVQKWARPLQSYGIYRDVQDLVAKAPCHRPCKFRAYSGSEPTAQ